MQDDEMIDEGADNAIPTWLSLNLLPCSSELEKKNPTKASQLYENAIADNAGSYKLWHAYLLHKTRQLDDLPINDYLYEKVNETYEKALVFMHKMPRIWIEYCTLLDRQLLITRTRRAFDRALESLPVTQHSRIWPLYLDFIKKEHIPVETAVRVYKRYMQFKPEDAEDFIDYLHSKNRIDLATRLLCDVINKPNFQSQRGKTKFELWDELCNMICDYADQIQSIDAEAVLRDAISRYKDEQGKLWNSLARYYVHLGMFATTRSIFEEAIQTVATKKDFVEIWEAYTNFEERFIEHLLDKGELNDEQLLDLEIRQEALEKLITNNGLLLSRVALRQNPHNVKEWQKRASLCLDERDKFNAAREETYREAVKTIDPKQASGKYDDLWIEYALFYNEYGLPDKTREIFESAIEAKFVKTEDLARVWCAYIEFEIKNNGDALTLAKRGSANVKNLNLWLLNADLEENFGNLNTTKAVYERILDLRIATPQVILNYASLLEENQYWEDSFKVYEKGVSLFKWPHSYSIWHTYIDKFLQRYGAKKLERMRDLLEKCLQGCPSKHAFDFYILYAKIEEQYGLFSRAHDVYTRAINKIDSSRKWELFRIYLRSMMKLVGIGKIREIYEQAIANLDNRGTRTFCLEYATLEESLGEIERARTLYSFCSQICNPRIDKEFWRIWAEFEQKHGNLDTIDDMLRIKRSVEALNPNTELLSDVKLDSATIAKAIEDNIISTSDKNQVNSSSKT